jgi:hypothetical protein
VCNNLRVPSTTSVRQDDTHRLIPSRYAEEGVLSALADEDDDLSDLYELEGATNGRLLAEAAGAPGIGVHELVFGIPNANIVNATFCYANPQGSRFNSHLRGAWYAGFAQDTSVVEVTFHLGEWLREVHWRPEDWEKPQVFPYVDFLADFRGEFHDLRNARGFGDCLQRDTYVPSQALAATLLGAGAPGIVYPSVRHNGGTCLVCFRPALVIHVRRLDAVAFVYSEPSANAKVLFKRARRKGY